MNNSLKTALKVLIPAVLTIAIVYFLFKKIELKDLLVRVAETNYFWVLVAVLLSICSDLSRAYRWNILIEPLGYKPKFINTFMALMIGYFGNIFLPRAGEVLRCVALNKTDQVPVNSAFGTVVTERIFDLLSLLFLILIAFVLEFERFSILFQEYILVKKGASGSVSVAAHPVLIGVFVCMIVLLLTFILFRNKLTKLAFYQKIVGFLSGLMEGMLSFRHLERKKAFLLHTILIWLCYYGVTYLMFFTLPATAHLGLLAGLVLLIVGGLGMSAPASGGIGPFHLMVAGALSLFYGLPHQDGIAYAFIAHTSQLLMILIVGGVASLITLFLNKSSEEV